MEGAEVAVKFHVYDSSEIIQYDFYQMEVVTGMEFQQISLAIVPEKGEKSAMSFTGRPLGRSVDESGDSGSFKTIVEIYQTRDNSFLTYVTYRNQSGEITLANFVETDSLDLGEVRYALKDERIYPGSMFGEAVYHSLNTLELLN